MLCRQLSSMAAALLCCLFGIAAASSGPRLQGAGRTLSTYLLMWHILVLDKDPEPGH